MGNLDASADKASSRLSHRAPVIVWLWSAGTASGVTHDMIRAQLTAESAMRSGGADVAIVDKAFYVLGVESLTDGYRPAGTRFVAERHPEGHVGRITWKEVSPGGRLR